MPGGVPLTKVSQKKNLGILIHNTCTVTAQVASAVKKPSKY